MVRPARGVAAPGVWSRRGRGSSPCPGPCQAWRTPVALDGGCKNDRGLTLTVHLCGGVCEVAPRTSSCVVQITVSHRFPPREPLVTATRRLRCPTPSCTPARVRTKAASGTDTPGHGTNRGGRDADLRRRARRPRPRAPRLLRRGAGGRGRDPASGTGDAGGAGGRGRAPRTVAWWPAGRSRRATCGRAGREPARDLGGVAVPDPDVGRSSGPSA